jgi:hypothetical protein
MSNVSKTSPKNVSSLADGKKYWDAMYGVNKASLPEDFEQLLNKFSHIDDVCIRIVDNSYTPVHILRQLAEHENVEVRAAVARRTDYPFEHAYAKETLTKITSVPVDVLEKLADDPHPKVRAALIYNHLTPEHVLTKLADDDDLDVIINFFDVLHLLPTYDIKRQQFAEKITTKLLKLAPELTLDIADFKQTPANVLEQIFNTTDNPGIEHAVMLNPNISETMALKYLNRHRLTHFKKINHEVVSNILSTADNLTQLNMFVEILKNNFLEHLASSPTGEFQTENMEDFERFISSGMFKNPHSLPETIQHLYETVDFTKKGTETTLTDYVNIAGNPNTPAHILEYFCINNKPEYEHPEIVEALTINISTPHSALLEPAFLKKIRTEEANYYAAVRLVRRGELSPETVKNIIYGDYSEFLIQYFAEYYTLGEEEQAYIALKYGTHYVRKK